MPELESAEARKRVLQEWLDRKQARCLWQIDTSNQEGHTKGSSLTAYMINGRVCIVQMFNGGTAWDIYTASPSVRWSDTLIDAERRLGLVAP